MFRSRVLVVVSAACFPALALCADPPTLSLHIDPLGPAGEALGFEAGVIARNLAQNLNDAGLPNSTVTADCTFKTPGRTTLSKVATPAPQGGSKTDDLKRQVVDLSEAHRKDQAALADLQARFRKVGADPALQGQIADLQSKLSQATYTNQKLTSDLALAQQAPATPTADLAAQLAAVTSERDKMKHQLDEDAAIRDEYAKNRDAAAELAEVRRQAYAFQNQKELLQQELTKANMLASRTLTAEANTRDAQSNLQSANKDLRDRENELSAQTKRAEQAELSQRHDQDLIKDLSARLQEASDKLNQANATLAGMTKGRWP